MLVFIVTSYARLLELKEAGHIAMRNVFYRDPGPTNNFTIWAAFDRDSTRVFRFSQDQNKPETFDNDFPHAILVEDGQEV